jgi:hypothetical protein
MIGYNNIDTVVAFTLLEDTAKQLRLTMSLPFRVRTQAWLSWSTGKLRHLGTPLAVGS